MYRISTHINETLENHLIEIAKNTDLKDKAHVIRRAILIIKQIYDAKKRGAKVEITEIDGRKTTVQI